MLVIFSGLPGTGKTMIARSLISGEMQDLTAFLQKLLIHLLFCWRVLFQLMNSKVSPDIIAL